MKTIFCSLLVATAALAAEPGDPEQGKALYNRYCISCHGEHGGGDGPSANWLDPRPRDFTRGLFKCRSTPGDSLPLDEDSIATLGRGLAHSAMPGWQTLSNRTKRDLVAYVKTFSPRFATEKPASPAVLPPKPPMTLQRMIAGREVYDRLGCAACHGPNGRGDGPSAATAVDDYSYPLRPRNLTLTGYKCGPDTPDTIAKDSVLGLQSTPMPSFADSLNPNDLWNLSFYTWALSHDDSGLIPRGPPIAPVEAGDAGPAAGATDGGEAATDSTGAGAGADAGNSGDDAGTP